MNFFIMISKLFYGGIYITVVRMVRIELTLRNRNGILSPARLPIPPHSHMCILNISKEMVARDRIELSTQGFSILCSTDWAIGPLLLLIKKWWWEKDSNLRSRRRRIYSPQDLTTLQPHHNEKVLKLIWMGY